MANRKPTSSFNTESSRKANAARWAKAGAYGRAAKLPWCVDCADTHSRERKLRILERLGDITPSEVYEGLEDLAYHLWRTKRMLEKDLAAVRKRNGWPDHQPQPYTDAERTLIVSLYRLGNTTGEIGKRLTPRRSYSAIYNFLKKKGLINEHRKTGRNGEAHPWGGR